MVVDVTEDPSISDKKSKKKRKRDTEEAGAAEASSSKKDKKKRKKDSEPAQGESEEPAPSEVKPPKEKKHKKDKKDKKSKETVVSAEPVASSSTAPSSSDAEAFLKKHEVTLHVPDGVPTPTPILSFKQLDIPAELRAAFDGFKEPTPIQACSWPPALEGRDVVGIAETGSGKTLAFGLPALARIIQNASKEPKKQKGTTVSVLVVAPTRELAIQTHETLEQLGAPFGIASVAVFGGVDKAPQIKTLKNANKDGRTTRIIVGTPGRLLDLVNDGACDLSRVSYMVLDEADRMLDKGFENDIRAIIGHTLQGAERQTLMFSATWPDAVRRLAATFQRDPIRVTVGSDDLTANSRVEQVVEVFDEPRSKDSRLLGHLKALLPKNSKGNPEDARILIFALYKKEATRVEGMLKSKGFSVMGLHGDMSQSARMDALQRFKSGASTLLVATDVAARGLDIPNVAAVINYTFPLTIEDYIHRIGRTGRGGKSGKSITFFTGENHERSLAGELARVLRESGFEEEGLKKFPMTIKKKEHGAYGAFFRDDIPVPKGPTKITF
ncbi:DEAD-domain-containing protein [Trametes versicolor FP-101664 SS1]|uniref:DEAD-domain-containing protein n=1 Tax=Trametes versicolor (strain FP-101664) TaxID=717944 RepID=UPI000462323C|nr:DEAD-domain-containing protein [Trametes versicolor FP-101664 SS1]EIW65288.1 DEAD-domain-containing protein [Trametes versicolor FP-101664 SS1]